MTIIEVLDKLLAVNGPLCHANSEMLEQLIPFNNIDVVTNAKAVNYDGKDMTISMGSNLEKIACDSVVLAIGYEEEKSLYDTLKYEVGELYTIGDAKKVSNIMYAIWDAFEVANHI